MISSFFVLIIKLYKLAISPFLGSNCRFVPTCSEYAVQSFEKHGALKGLLFSTGRILRCNPFSKGGFDPA